MKRDINLVMAQEVVGKVSLHLARVTLDQALDAITLAGGAAYIKHGTTYHVYKPKEDKDPQAGRLQMRIFRLKYAKTEKIQDILDAIPGKRLIKFHEPSKTVIVEDTPENVMKIETIIRFLDKKPRQVMIEAKILKIDLTDDMSLGVNWEQLLGDARIASGGFSTAISATAGGVSPVPAGGTGAFANMITGVGSRHQFTAALSALQTETKVDTLSSPKILAIHGEPAKVQVGGQQGYKVTNVTGTGIATESVLFIDTGTILEITPYIDDEDGVLLYVQPSINSATIDETGIPSVVSTAVSTWLLAKSGETVFIAGLIEDTGTKTRGMIPCIGNIPWLGWLFRRTSRNIGKSEFLVLISPSVIQTGQESVDKMAIEKVKKLEEAFERAPLPPDRELLDSPWPRE
jgi:type II secretory pathway component GspD/PulD (secretin)